jgi:pimeloyl-ACP methyl ester carboxylesterase
MEPGTICLDGFRHRYHVLRPERPRSVPLVALHGFGTTGYRTFRYAAPFFEERGIPLVAPDLLGFGESDKPEGVYSLRRYAALLIDFLDVLDLGKPVLLGHSMGGKIAAAAAALFPERFSGLILVNSGGFSLLGRLMPPLARARWTVRLFRQPWFLRHVLPRTPLGPVFSSPESIDQLARLRCSHYALDLDATGLRPRLRSITLPSLILWGDDDPILPRGTAERILRDLPHARIERLPGAGHAPMKDQPVLFTEAVAAFMPDRRA